MKKGFTVVELLLAVGLSALVVSTATYLLHQFFSEHKNLEVWSSGQFEMSSALKDIEGDVRNIVRFDPKEEGAQEYLGIAAIAAGSEPSQCLNTADAPVMRYTSLDRKSRSERVLRAWSEVDSSGKTQPKDELRISADNSTSSLFTQSKGPKEIVLVDADRRYIRRYEVVRHVMHLNSNTDPYDNLPKVDSFGNPVFFNYVSVFLNNPKGIVNENTNKKASVFVTGSEVYNSRTYFVCLRKTDRSLIKINQATNEVSVLLLNTNADFEIERFVIGYLGTRRGVRVEPANFQANMAGATGDCVNTILLEINLKATQAFINRTQQNAVGEVKKDIVRRRTVFSPNLNIKRPLSCQE
ncbi:type II secretion system protein J [Bdellovibrio bacteriovorus]|uniref:PulJ/GspJ family protein n=1 Tax=Bdellovibrio bacteriovorus TaxID=959 RepID=UPI0035A8FB0D